jgi:hypothetical protein
VPMAACIIPICQPEPYHHIHYATTEQPNVSMDRSGASVEKRSALQDDDGQDKKRRQKNVDKKQDA